MKKKKEKIAIVKNGNSSAIIDKVWNGYGDGDGNCVNYIWKLHAIVAL